MKRFIKWAKQEQMAIIHAAVSAIVAIVIYFIVAFNGTNVMISLVIGVLAGIVCYYSIKFIAGGIALLLEKRK